jgi:hypothetical protein
MVYHTIWMEMNLAVYRTGADQLEKEQTDRTFHLKYLSMKNLSYFLMKPFIG